MGVSRGCGYRLPLFVSVVLAGTLTAQFQVSRRPTANMSDIFCALVLKNETKKIHLSDGRYESVVAALGRYADLLKQRIIIHDRDVNCFIDLTATDVVPDKVQITLERRYEALVASSTPSTTPSHSMDSSTDTFTDVSLSAENLEREHVESPPSRSELPGPSFEVLDVRVVDRYDYKKYPSTSLYSRAVDLLLAKYPHLRDRLGSGDGSWLKALRDKFKNEQCRLTDPISAILEKKQKHGTKRKSQENDVDSAAQKLVRLNLLLEFEVLCNRDAEQNLPHGCRKFRNVIQNNGTSCEILAMDAALRDG